MKEAEVPDSWVDAALNSEAPGDRDDARFYLANAYETIREDLLWGQLKREPYITCACGMDWEPNAYQGPDYGHGRYACPASGDAVLRFGKGQVVCEVSIRKWRYTVLADWAEKTGRRLIRGWLPQSFDPTADNVTAMYNGGRLVWAHLPGGQRCPIGQKVSVEMKGYGDGEGLFLKVEWHDKSWE